MLFCIDKPDRPPTTIVENVELNDEHSAYNRQLSIDKPLTRRKSMPASRAHLTLKLEARKEAKLDRPTTPQTAGVVGDFYPYSPSTEEHHDEPSVPRSQSVRKMVRKLTGKIRRIKSFHEPTPQPAPKVDANASGMCVVLSLCRFCRM